jgi:hypothetical protein
MPQNERRRAPFIMAQKRMHIRATNTNACNFNQNLSAFGLRIRHILERQNLWAHIDKCLHDVILPLAALLHAFAI